MFSRTPLLALVLFTIAVVASPALHIHISGSDSPEDFKITVNSGETRRLLEYTNGPLSHLPTDHFALITDVGAVSVFSDKHAGGPANVEPRDCTAGEIQQALQAANAAQVLVERAASELLLKGAAGPTYRTWFGERSDARFAKVSTTFGLLHNSRFAEYEYKCGGGDCTDPSVVAWVDTKQYGKYYLCPPFFDAKLPVTGQHQSRASSIVHESTHFLKNGAIDDHLHLTEGGEAKLKDLAQRLPDWAITNAANYELFAATAAGNAFRPGIASSQTVLVAKWGADEKRL